VKKLLFVLLALVVVSSLAFIGCPAKEPEAEGPVELSMVMFLPDFPPVNLWTHMFMDKVAAISNGDLVINLIGGPEAIPTQDQPAAVQRGTVDIANAMGNFTDTLIPGVECLARAEIDPAGIRKTPAFPYIQEKAEEVGIYYLGASSPSEPQDQTNFFFKDVISTIDDIAGKKIASTGGTSREFIEALGAVCVPIDFMDYFTAMERGTVDAYYIGTPGILDIGGVDVTGCMLDEPFSSSGAHFLVNLDKWNSLSKAQQDVLTQAAIETEIDGIIAWNDLVDGVKTQISAEGVEIVKFSPAESKEFYLTYRESLWPGDIARHPEEATYIKQFIVDPDFYRAK
jgi:TRAP-type C4-dicarboxylate transport system substrate-binding protein